MILPGDQAKDQRAKLLYPVFHDSVKNRLPVQWIHFLDDFFLRPTARVRQAAPSRLERYAPADRRIRRPPRPGMRLCRPSYTPRPPARRAFCLHVQGPPCARARAHSRGSSRSAWCAPVRTARERRRGYRRRPSEPSARTATVVPPKRGKPAAIPHPSPFRPPRRRAAEVPAPRTALPPHSWW